MRYWVVVLTRNGAASIAKTLESIFKQSLKPSCVVTVDDGSTDQTPRVIEVAKKATSTPVVVIRLPDTGYDIRRVEANINRASSRIQRTRRQYDYFMISSDDCIFPPNYCSSLIQRMEENRNIAVSSGDFTPISEYAKLPQGTGRIIRESFWKQIGARYPVGYGAETWLLIKARQMGYQCVNYQEIRFEHLRPSGAMHRHKHWGISMRALGDQPLTILFRFASAVKHREPITFANWLTIFTEYFLPVAYQHDPYLLRYDKDLLQFVSEQQLETLLNARKIKRFRGLVAALWRVLSRISGT